ncbi:DUF4386 domain-containing protein [Flavobacterium sp.]|uniref:DUF4386 domain-containing protein n=1 Tax=Flavobacterium sp. TaxID=239 RepID=UPI002FD99A1B
MNQKRILLTARITGVWYLLLAISGVLGFIIFQSNTFVAKDPYQTLSNIIAQESTVRIRLFLEVIIIISQALVAIWFYRLFKKINSWAAFAISTWGLMNAAAIMISAVSMATAIKLANFPAATEQEKIVFIHLLNVVISNAWLIGGLFFGLWLIPMGYTIITSKCMPLWLGRILIIGGMGYILGTIIKCIGFSHPMLAYITIPATIGEFWMICYLLIFGIRGQNILIKDM